MSEQKIGTEGWVYYSEYSTCGCSFIAPTEEENPETCPDHTHRRMKHKVEPASMYAGLEMGLAGGYCDCAECLRLGRNKPITPV